MKKVIVSASIAILVLLILGCISAPPPETPPVEDPADSAAEARETAPAAMKAMDESIAGVEANAEEAKACAEKSDLWIAEQLARYRANAARLRVRNRLREIDQFRGERSFPMNTQAAGSSMRKPAMNFASSCGTAVELPPRRPSMFSLLSFTPHPIAAFFPPPMWYGNCPAMPTASGTSPAATLSTLYPGTGGVSPTPTGIRCRGRTIPI